MDSMANDCAEEINKIVFSGVDIWRCFDCEVGIE